MNLFGQTKSNISRTASVLGTVGLSAIALLSVAKAAGAASIRAGFDYLETGSGTSINFTHDNFSSIPEGQVVTVDFQGLPIANLGLTDTIVERKNDVNIDVGGSGQTPIEIVDLSLKSNRPLNIGGLFFDVFATLNPNTPSTGSMSINHQNLDTANTQGTWTSSFNLFGTAILTPQGTFAPQSGGKANLLPACQVQRNLCINFDKVFTTNTPVSWSHLPQAGNFVGPDSSNFFTVGTALHDAGSGQHVVRPASVPEPLTIIGSGIAAGFGIFFKKEASKKRKKQTVS